MSGYFLRVKTPSETYSFGLNPGGYWKQELPFEVSREDEPAARRWAMLAIRAAFVLYLANSVWG